MNVEVEETGQVERKLRIEIPTADVDATFEQVYRTMAKGARIPGFRRGKAPRSVMERYFGDQARSEVLERLVQKSLPEAVEEVDLAVVGEPQLDPGEPPREGSPFAYEATFDIRPSITLEKIRGLEVVRPSLPEPDEDPVEAHLEELRLQQAQLVEEAEGVLSARGHQAVIDYEATVDGAPFGGSKGEETVVELGEGRALPGLEEQLEGMVVGQEREFELEMPDTYPEQDVRGKSAQFKVKLVALKRRELPELDDELAVDASQFDTLAELREDLERRVQEGRDREAQRLLREAVLDALVAANPFPVPQRLVDRQLSGRLQRAVQQLQQLPQAEMSKLVERWREEWRPQAERDVQLALLVPEICAAEKIEVSDEDVDERLAPIAEQQGQSLAQVKRSYREQGMLDAMRSGLLEERLLDFLIAEATVSDG